MIDILKIGHSCSSSVLKDREHYGMGFYWHRRGGVSCCFSHGLGGLGYKKFEWCVCFQARAIYYYSSVWAILGQPLCDVVAGSDWPFVSNIFKYTHFTLQLLKRLVSVNRDVNSARGCNLAYRVKSKYRRWISTKANSEVWYNVSHPTDEHRKRGYRLPTRPPRPN